MQRIIIQNKNKYHDVEYQLKLKNCHVCYDSLIHLPIG